MYPINPNSISFHAFLLRKGIAVPLCSIASYYRRGTVPPVMLQGLISEYSGIPLYNPLLYGAAEAPDMKLLCLTQRARYYLRLGAVPLAYRHGRMVIGIIDPNTCNDSDIFRLLQNFTPEYVVIRPDILEQTVDAVFSDLCLHKATELLREKLPFYSACRLATPRRRVLAASVAAMLPLTFSMWNVSVSMVITGMYGFGALCYTGAFGMKLAVFIAGWFQRGKVQAYPPVEDARLPVYSIMVPVYKEPDILPQLTRALTALDYPRDKLDIVIIAEEDDLDTRRAFAVLQTPGYMRMIAVPPSLPRTKPKACNYVLPLLRGECAVIYDAEDIPAPGQLREAAAAFAGGAKDCVIYQAPLNFYNGNANLLTRWFALEYAGHFEYMLRGIAATGIPLPLGGTSNHFNYDALTRAGGWDPFNVTEDADLGVRLYARRKHAGMLSKTTMEEAPETIRSWVCQRSRWIKGHMQTALVHSRVSAATLPRIGGVRFAGMHAFLTLPILCYILAPLLLLVGGVHIAACAAETPLCSFMPPTLPTEFVSALWPTVYAAQCMFSALSVRHTVASRGFAGWIAIGLSPCYWILHCVAAYKALWQLVTKPHYWEKTTHGARFKVRVQ